MPEEKPPRARASDWRLRSPARSGSTGMGPCFCALGDKLRAEGGNPEGWAARRTHMKLSQRLWGSLANVDWTHENGDTAAYTFRAAGDLIAAIVGEGDYMDWYCSGPCGCVDTEVAEAMAREGWHPIQGARPRGWARLIKRTSDV